MADVDVSLGLKAQELLTELQATTAKLRAFANEARTHGDAAGQGFSSGLRRSLGGIQSFFSNIKHLATSTLGLIGIGVGTGALVHEVKSTIEFGAHIEDLSRKLGVNAGELSRWGLAAQKAGTDVDSLGKFLGFLEVNREKALKNTGGKQFQGFEDLGVTKAQLADKNVSPLDLAAQIGKGDLSPDSLKAVGGRSALDVRTLLAEVGHGGADLDKGISAGDTAKLKKLEDAFINLKQVLTVTLAPAITQVFDLIGTGAKSADVHVEAFKTHMQEASIQLVAIAKASAQLQNYDVIGAFKTLQKGREDTQDLERKLAPKLLPNPEPTENLDVPLGTGGSLRLSTNEIEDDKKAAAQRDIFKRFGGPVGDEEDKAEDKELKKEAKAADKAATKAEKEADRAEKDAEKDYYKEIKAEDKAERDNEIAEKKRLAADEKALGGRGRSRGSGGGGGGAGGGGTAGGTGASREQAIQDLFNDPNVSPTEFFQKTGRIDARARPAQVKSGLETHHVEGSGGLSPYLDTDAFHNQFKSSNERVLGSKTLKEQLHQGTAEAQKKDAVDPLKESAKSLREAADQLKNALKNQ